MKKLLALLLLLLLLCSCGAEEKPIENPRSEAEVPESSESEEIQYPLITMLEYGNFNFNFNVEKTVYEDGSEILKIFDPDGNRIGGEYTDLSVIGSTGELCAFAAETEGKATRLFYDENGDPYSEEVTAVYYYILDENGRPVVDKAFESFEILPGSDVSLRGISEGGIYDYHEENGKLNPVYFDEAFEEDWGNGFFYTGYFYNSGSWYYGIKKNGEVLYDNVYTGISLYFGNRFWLWMECEDGSLKARLGNENGNIICDKFESFGWCPVNEEKCIGTASVGRQERGEYAPTFDENGEPMPEGVWFIDKDGNIISERFENIELIYDKDKEVPWGQHGFDSVCAKAAKVTFENGETEIIDITEYLLDY